MKVCVKFGGSGGSFGQSIVQGTGNKKKDLRKCWECADEEMELCEMDEFESGIVDYYFVKGAKLVDEACGEYIETDGEGEFLTAVDSKGKEYDLDSLHSRELAAAAAKKPPDQKPPAKKKRTAKKKGRKSKRK